MSILQMKVDLQKAVANNINEYEAIYDTLIFEDESWDYFKSFKFFENLKIAIKNNDMIFNIRLDKEILKKLTKEDIERIKKNDLKHRLQECIVQKIVKDNFSDNAKYEIIASIENKEINEEEVEAREPNSIEIIKMKEIQRILKEELNMNSELVTGEVYYYLQIISPEIELNKKGLKILFQIIQEVDIFSILPTFNDKDEIDGIKLFFGINLTI